jgi:hypothetical protein
MSKVLESAQDTSFSGTWPMPCFCQVPQVIGARQTMGVIRKQGRSSCPTAPFCGWPGKYEVCSGEVCAPSIASECRTGLLGSGKAAMLCTWWLWRAVVFKSITLKSLQK